MVTEEMLKVLDGFHNWVARRISGMLSQKVGEEIWDWSLVAYALEASGMWPMKEYIKRRQATIVDYIANLPIYELCTGAEPILGPTRLMQWWN